MAIGFMASKLGENLARYMPFLQPVLIVGLKNIEEYQVMTEGPCHAVRCQLKLCCGITGLQSLICIAPCSTTSLRFSIVYYCTALSDCIA